jgi:hypothetical protein
VSFLDPQLRPQDIIARIQRLKRRIRDVERAPMPDVFEEVGEIILNGVMLALVDESGFGTPTTYILHFDGERWHLIATITDGMTHGGDSGLADTTTFAIKAPNGDYVINVDPQTDAYPDSGWNSTNGGKTWDGFFEDPDANGGVAIPGRDGTVWGFRTDGSFGYHIFKDGVLSYTFPEGVGPDAEYLPYHIAVHPTNPNIVAVKGIHQYPPDSGSGSDNENAVFVVTIDGGDSWTLTETTEEQESTADSFEHLNLRFTDTGRLVCVSTIEFFGGSGSDTIYVRYADSPYTSFTLVHEASLWELADDHDWENGPNTGGLTGTSKKLFFLGNSSLVDAGTQASDSHVFMSRNNAASWVELTQPDPGLTGLHYDEIDDNLYGFVHDIGGTGIVLLMMESPAAGRPWRNVTRGIPVSLNEFTNPFTQQAIWGY